MVIINQRFMKLNNVCNPSNLNYFFKEAQVATRESNNNMYIFNNIKNKIICVHLSIQFK